MIIDVAFLTDAQIQAYVDGTLSPSENAIVERFLRNNPSCEKMVEIYRQQDRALSRLYRSDPDQEIFSNVEDWISENFSEAAE